MNRFIRIAVLAVLLISAFASIGYCTANNWGNTDTNPLLARQLPNDLIYVGAARGGVSTMVSGSLAIPVGYAVAVKAITEVATPLTLADGVVGQIITVQISTMSGGASAILTPTTKTGFTTITFDAAREYATLLFLDATTGWVCISTNATTA